MSRFGHYSKLAAALAAWVLIYLALAPRSVLAADGLYLVPGVIAMALMVRVLLARDAAHRRFWLWFAPGVVLAGTGDILWALFELIGVEPTPSPADACYLVGELLIVIALLRGSRAWSWLRSARALIDASVLCAAVLTIGFGVLVAPQVAGEIDAPLALALGYSGLGVLALVPALLLCLNGRGVPLAILLVACGQVASMGGDLVYTWLEAGGNYRSGHPVDLLWMTDYALAAAAAVVAMRAPRRAPQPLENRDAGIVLLLAGLTGLLGYWLIADRPAWVAGVIVFAIAAMAVRLLLTARDNRRIASELSAALADGERMAVTDPLTGLLNRRAIEQALRAHEGPLGVIVLELETAALGFEQRDESSPRPSTASAGRRGGPVIGRTGAAEPPPPCLTRPARGDRRARRRLAAEPSRPARSAPARRRLGAGMARRRGSRCGPAQRARELGAGLGGNELRVRRDDASRCSRGLADEADRRRGREAHGPRRRPLGRCVPREFGLDDADPAAAASWPPAARRRPDLRTGRLSCAGRT